MKKVNLFLVGAAKSGTTSLANYLSQHPEIYFSEPKEPVHFCKDIIKESDKYQGFNQRYFKYRNKKDYQKLYAKSNNEKYLAEGTVLYLYSHVAAREIYNYNPNSQIIIILREPVELIFSLYNHYKFYGMENAKSIEEALKLERKRKQGNSIPKLISAPSLTYYSDFTDFKSQIDRFFFYFSKNINIVFLDDLNENPRGVTENLFKKLGLNSYPIQFSKKNEYKTHKYKLVENLLTTEMKIKRIIKKIFPKYIQTKLYKFLIKNNKVHNPTKKPTLDPDLKKKLKRERKNEIVELEKYLHEHNLIDKKADLVSKWNY